MKKKGEKGAGYQGGQCFFRVVNLFIVVSIKMGYDSSCLLKINHNFCVLQSWKNQKQYEQDENDILRDGGIKRLQEVIFASLRPCALSGCVYSKVISTNKYLKYRILGENRFSQKIVLAEFVFFSL